MKKNIEIKNKIVNHLTSKGEKKRSEKLLTKSFKKLQKTSVKQTKEIIKLSIISSTPIFKLHKITNKKFKKKNRKIKEIPAFIKNKNIRTSLSIKLIIESAKNKKPNYFFQKLKQEILNGAKQNKLTAIEYKNNLQIQVLTNKHYLTYYRWS